jgi:hypothetical protein
MVLLLWRRVTLNPKPTYPMKGEVLRELHARRNHWFEISESFYETFETFCFDLLTKITWFFYS